MRKIIIGSIVAVLTGCATDKLNMNDLKCRDMQIYSNTTLQDVRNSCLIYKQFPIKSTDSFAEPKGAHYEVQFNSVEPAGRLVHCNFDGVDPSAKVIGCRVD